MFELGFYMHSLFGMFSNGSNRLLNLAAHFQLETVRSDFWEMLLHHVVTIALVVFSWSLG